MEFCAGCRNDILFDLQRQVSRVLSLPDVRLTSNHDETQIVRNRATSELRAEYDREPTCRRCVGEAVWLLAPRSVAYVLSDIFDCRDIGINNLTSSYNNNNTTSVIKSGGGHRPLQTTALELHDPPHLLALFECARYGTAQGAIFVCWSQRVVCVSFDWFISNFLVVV